MKKINLKSVKIESNTQAKDTDLNYQREFLRIVEVCPDGLTASQMGLAIKISQKLQAAGSGGRCLLEDAEHAYLLEKLKAAKFGYALTEIVDMVQSVQDAESYEPSVSNRAGQGA